MDGSGTRYTLRRKRNGDAGEPKIAINHGYIQILLPFVYGEAKSGFYTSGRNYSFARGRTGRGHSVLYRTVNAPNLEDLRS